MKTYIKLTDARAVNHEEWEMIMIVSTSKIYVKTWDAWDEVKKSDPKTKVQLFQYVDLEDLENSINEYLEKNLNDFNILVDIKYQMWHLSCSAMVIIKFNA